MKPVKRVFITGGASGLGRALAERYARAGARVCIGDINEERGREVEALLRSRGTDATFLRCNVMHEADLHAAAAWVEQAWGGVDVVVNDAGVAVSGAITDVPIEDWRWILDVNLLGIVRGCREFTPLLRRGGGGRFVNIASMAGLVHPPLMAPYNATKAAVIALSETLYHELSPDGISVTVACPSFFRTHLAETARATTPELDAATHRLVERARTSAEEVAAIVYAAAEKGEFLVLTHADGKVAWLMKRLVPFGVYADLVARGARRMMGHALPHAPRPKEAP